MSKIITENFKIETTKELFKSFQNQNSTLSANFRLQLDAFVAGNADLTVSTGDADSIQGFMSNQLTALRPESDYYIMASTALSPTEASGSTAISNTEKSKRDFLRKVIFGVKVESSIARYMFYENQWLTGTIYDAFDDTKDIETQNTIVTVAAGNGDYLVYKCIENNGGSPSTASLPTEINSNSYQLVQIADRYVWHYMFTVAQSEADAYRSAGSLPLPEPEPGVYGNKSVIDNAKSGISQIVIDSALSAQFSQFLFGDATNIDDGSDVSIINPEASGSLPSKKVVVVQTTAKPGRQLYDSVNAYKDMYLRNGNTGKLYNVSNSVSDVPSNQITLTIDTLGSDVIDSAQLHQLVPKIMISSSALGEESAKAYGILDQYGTLSRIGFETKGDKYKFANAYVAYPPPLKEDSGKNNPAILRVVVSPSGGHGSNPRSEMAMSRLAVVANFSGDSSDIPDANTYTKVGLVKNPTFTSSAAPLEFDNRTKITVASANSGDSAADKFLEQYVRTIPVQDMLTAKEYIISNVGTMTALEWQSLGVVGTPVAGKTFTSSFSSVQSDFDGNVSVSIDITQYDSSSEYDEIVRGKIHQVEVVSTNTVISVTDYIGDFQNNFMPGNVYIKTLQSSSSVPTSVITINSFSEIVYGTYNPYSGELLHFIDFSPITRQTDRREKVKFTFDF